MGTDSKAKEFKSDIGIGYFEGISAPFKGVEFKLERIIEYQEEDER